MLINIPDMFNKMIEDELKVSHLEKKISSKVVEVDKLNKTMKDAITKANGAKFLKDCDLICGFVELGGTPVEENPEDAEEEEGVETEDTEKQEPEQNNAEGGKDDSGKEGTDEKKDDAEKKDEEEDKEAVNESIKIEDLTKSMVSVPKAKKTCCEGEKKKKSEKKPKAAPAPTEVPPQEDSGDDAPGDVEEAETEATGDELRGKVSKALERIFKSQQTDTNKIELFDVKDLAEGQNVYFAKFTLRDHEGQTEEK